MNKQDERFMQLAIDLSIENVANGGGPFGAVIVKDGEVVATGKNRVTANNDPQKCLPSEPPARSRAPSSSKAAPSTPRASPAPCA